MDVYSAGAWWSAVFTIFCLLLIRFLLLVSALHALVVDGRAGSDGLCGRRGQPLVNRVYTKYETPLIEGVGFFVC